MRPAPPAVLLLLALCTGCRWTSADEQLLAEFFAASRAYDRTRLAAVATVVFNPVTDGIVHTFDIIDSGPERADPSGARIRTVTICASVIPPEGAAAERQLLISLAERNGRWIVSGVRQEGTEGTEGTGSHGETEERRRTEPVRTRSG